MKLPGSTLIPCRNQTTPDKTKRLPTIFSIILIPGSLSSCISRDISILKASHLGSVGACRTSMCWRWPRYRQGPVPREKPATASRRAKSLFWSASTACSFGSCSPSCFHLEEHQTTEVREIGSGGDHVLMRLPRPPWLRRPHPPESKIDSRISLSSVSSAHRLHITSVQ